MLLHVVKTKEGLIVMETPHIGRANYYMKRFGKVRGFTLSKKIARGIIK